MKKIKLTAKLFVSPLGKTFWVRSTNPHYDKAIGIGLGVHHAINDFIESFNECRFEDKEGRIISIDTDSIVKPVRPYKMEYIVHMPFRSHRDYRNCMHPQLESVWSETLTIRSPEERDAGMPILVRGTDDVYQHIDMSMEARLGRLERGYI